MLLYIVHFSTSLTLPTYSLHIVIHVVSDSFQKIKETMLLPFYPSPNNLLSLLAAHRSPRNDRSNVASAWLVGGGFSTKPRPLPHSSSSPPKIPVSYPQPTSSWPSISMTRTLPADTPTLWELEAAALMVGGDWREWLQLRHPHNTHNTQEARIGNARAVRGTNDGGGGQGKSTDGSRGGQRDLNQGWKRKKYLTCILLRRQVFRVFLVCTSRDK
jgi:hypothetical protein